MSDMERSDRTIVVALGGNAILKPGQRGTAGEQFENIEKTCESIAEMIAKGYDVVVTHGNGPQVGNILIQNEEAKEHVPPMPLDVCGAESQGMIGYMIQRSLTKHLRAKGIERTVATVVTEVVVDEQDPAFKNPTKPIGPFYSRERAEQLAKERSFAFREDAGRGFRRVVPSPDPKYLVEREAVRHLLRMGVIVIAAGGGGIPVIEREGRLVGVEAVIDKDLAAERLASDVQAGTLLILTDVERVSLNFGKRNEKPIDEMSVKEAEMYLRQRHFAPGSMGPKVQAAIRFLRSGGARAIITSLVRGIEALDGRAGTSLRA